MVQRYGDGQAKEAATYVDRVLASVAAVLSVEDISGMSRTKLEGIYRQIRDVTTLGYSQMGTEMMRQLDLFGEFEAEFTVEMLAANATVAIAFDKVRESFVDAIMNTKPGVQMTIGEALSDFGKKKARDIVRTVSDAHLGGLTSQAAVLEVSRMAPMHKGQAGTLVRTMVNAISTQARNDVFSQNSDILSGVEWVSTLDSRTSLVCASRDGEIYPLNSGPRPPAHYGCRSTVVAVVKPEYDALPSAGVRPSVGAGGAEQVSGSTTYGGWLKRQPAAFQDEVLGSQRAALFRRGGLSIDSFVDRSGRTYNLDELRRLQPLAFERANLS